MQFCIEASYISDGEMFFTIFRLCFVISSVVVAPAMFVNKFGLFFNKVIVKNINYSNQSYLILFKDVVLFI